MVLLITQNDQWGRYMVQWLSLKGYPCSLASTGEEGLKRAKSEVPTVIVLDLYMKDPSGMDVLHRLREEGFRGKVILMGGISVSPMIPEALRLGVDQVIGGDSNLGPLECAIQAAIQSASSLKDREKEQPSTN